MADEENKEAAAAAPASDAALPPEPAAAVAPAVTTAPADQSAALNNNVVPAVEMAEPEKPDDAQATLLGKFDEEQKAKDTKPEVKSEPEKTENTEKTEKPAETAKAEEKTETPVETKPETPPAEAVEYKYTLPETLKMDDALKGEVHAALDAFRANPSDGVQGLIDLHNKQMTAYAQEVARNQTKVWNDTNQAWQKEVLADPEIGGAGHQTAMGAIARMRDLFVPEKDRVEFDKFLQVTGAGNHPAFLRMLHNAARFYDEPSLPPPNAKPVPGNGQRAPSRLRDLYSNSRSQRGS